MISGIPLGAGFVFGVGFETNQNMGSEYGIFKEREPRYPLKFHWILGRNGDKILYFFYKWH